MIKSGVGLKYFPASFAAVALDPQYTNARDTGQTLSRGVIGMPGLQLLLEPFNPTYQLVGAATSLHAYQARLQPGEN